MNSFYHGCTVYYILMNNVISRGDMAVSKWDSIYGCSRCLIYHILAIVLQVPTLPFNAISLTHILLGSLGSHLGVFRFIFWWGFFVLVFIFVLFYCFFFCFFFVCLFVFFFFFLLCPHNPIFKLYSFQELCEPQDDIYTDISATLSMSLLSTNIDFT